jgi:PleD family two-component response regulator
MRSETGAAEQKIEILVVEDSVTQAEQLKYLLEERRRLRRCASIAQGSLSAMS